jgi:DNA-binding response OmpR family regulator
MPKILYADDDETSRCSIERLLSLEGHECVAVSGGTVGMQWLRDREFDCVISDLNMQGNANLEFIRSVPKLRPGIPVIIVTGYPSLETAVASLQLPVVAYLTKPVDFNELLKELRAALLRSTLIQQVEQMRANQNFALADLDQLAESLRQSTRGPIGTPMSVFLTLTYRNVLDSLLGLKAVMEKSVATGGGAEKAEGGHSPLLLVEALRETIDVLEKTKDAFRSRDLGALRKKLEKLLDADKEQRQDEPSPAPPAPQPVSS